jgi:hypothetical protein
MSTVTKVLLSKGALIIALAVEHHDRMIAPSQDVHVVLGIYRHTGTLDISDSLGQLAPTLDIFVAKIANTVDLTHRLIPPLITDMALVTDTASAYIKRTSTPRQLKTFSSAHTLQTHFVTIPEYHSG